MSMAQQPPRPSSGQMEEVGWPVWRAFRPATRPRQGQAIHEVERGLWKTSAGHRPSLPGPFFLGPARRWANLGGDGPHGPGGSSGSVWEERPRPALPCRSSVCSNCRGLVYGSREGQKIEFVPLEPSLAVAGERVTRTCCKTGRRACAWSRRFGQVAATLLRFFGPETSRSMAWSATKHGTWPERGGGVPVGSAGRRRRRTRKGSWPGGPVPTARGSSCRRSADDPGAARVTALRARRRARSRWPRWAACYTVDRPPAARPRRCGAGIVPRIRGNGPPPPAARKPQHKHVWAQPDAGATADGEDFQHRLGVRGDPERGDRAEPRAVGSGFGRWFVSMTGKKRCGTPATSYPAVGRHRHPWICCNVTPAVVEGGARVFTREGSKRGRGVLCAKRCLRILQGGVGGVDPRLARDGDQARRDGRQERKTITQVCGYFRERTGRDALRPLPGPGIPDRQRVIEGACRHPGPAESAGSVPACTGRPAGAQAMLDVRSMHVDGDWESYQGLLDPTGACANYTRNRSLVEGTQ